MKNATRVTLLSIQTITAIFCTWAILHYGCKSSPRTVPPEYGGKDTPTVWKDTANEIHMATIIRYIEKMGRCRQLQDSQQAIYILYTADRATWQDYQRSRKLYEKYYKNVYTPALDSINSINKISTNKQE